MTVIKVNENNKVVFVLRGEMARSVEVDDKAFFEVDEVPVCKKNTQLFYNPDEKSVFSIELDEQSMHSMQEARRQRDYALRWLANNDWKINKRMLGEWSEDDDRWTSYLLQRKIIKDVYDRAQDILQGAGFASCND